MITDAEIEAAGLGATLPKGYLWGPDAMEQFEVGKRRATAAILAALAEAGPASKPDKRDLCLGDHHPCRVGAGTDDAHFRCGTSQCGRKAPLNVKSPASAGEEP